MGIQLISLTQLNSKGDKWILKQLLTKLVSLSFHIGNTNFSLYFTFVEHIWNPCYLIDQKNRFDYAFKFDGK